MANNATSHKITRIFNITVELDGEGDEDRPYKASCNELTGCRIHASSEAEALDKAKRAIDIWVDFANRSLGDDFDIEDYMLDNYI